MFETKGYLHRSKFSWWSSKWVLTKCLTAPTGHKTNTVMIQSWCGNKSVFVWNFPQICCCAACLAAIRSEVDRIPGVKDLSHSLDLSGVASVINVAKEPQVALTLQPYLWLASWNEHSPHCAHTRTHTPVSRGLKKPCRTCSSGNWTLRTTWRHTLEVVQLNSELFTEKYI